MTDTAGVVSETATHLWSGLFPVPSRLGLARRQTDCQRGGSAAGDETAGDVPSTRRSGVRCRRRRSPSYGAEIHPAAHSFIRL